MNFGKYQFYDLANVCQGRKFLAFIGRRLKVHNKPLPLVLELQPGQGRGLESCYEYEGEMSFYGGQSGGVK